MIRCIRVFLLLLASLPALSRPVVVATASMMADMARNIAGDRLDVHCIVPIGGDPHLYEPTPRDARLLAGAQLILKNGLTFEGWLNELINHSGTKAAIVTITEGIDAIRSEQFHGAADPHAWMSAHNGLFYIDNIKKAFQELDPAGAADYERNCAAYRSRLEALDAYIREQIQTVPEGKRVLVTSHDAFQYYGRRYGIRLESVLGTSTEAEVQVGDIIRLNKVIRSTGVPAVFIETTINPKVLQQLASDNGVQIGGKLYADSIGDEQSPAPTYLGMLRYNTDVIVGALKGQGGVVGQALPLPGKTPLWLWAPVSLLFLSGFWYLYKNLSHA